MTTITINGRVKVIETVSNNQWAAFVLEDSPWKIIVKGEQAGVSLKEVQLNDEVVASGSYVKNDSGVFKLFADYCMKL